MIATTNKTFDFTRWSFKLALLAAFISALAVLGHRFTVIDFQPALLGLAFSALAALSAIVSGLIGTTRAIRTKEAEIASTLAGSTLGLLIVTPMLLIALSGARAPLIHDITTDLAHPPEFVAIKALRTAAHNPLDRHAPENLTDLQQEGYPDLQPLLLNRPYDRVFAQAAALVKERGWEIAAVSAANGRIEATDTTRIMGFKDDVVIRVQAMGNKTRIDMRSTSRTGKGDLGMNAARIRLFLADLAK